MTRRHRFWMQPFRHYGLMFPSPSTSFKPISLLYFVTKIIPRFLSVLLVLIKCSRQRHRLLVPLLNGPVSPRPARSGRVVCFHWGIPGHIAPNCFRRRRESGWQSNAPLGRRFAPYPRLLGQSQQDQSSNNSPRR